MISAGYRNPLYDAAPVPTSPAPSTSPDRCADHPSHRTASQVDGAVAERHLPAWAGKVTPHVLRHFCASQLYLGGMNLFAIQELLGHAWTATTARYINPQELHQMHGKPQVA